METFIEKRLEKLKQALRNIPAEAMLERITDENKSLIEDKNIAQLEAGKDSNANDITPAYSEFTKRYKQSKGQVYDRVTLHDTGSFYNGITANPMSTGFEMINNDSKWGKLTEKYGEAIIGLSEKSISELREEVYYPEMKRELVNYFDTADV
jgi:hypothetical protein